MSEENTVNQDQNVETEQVVPSLDIQRIYVKDISFEAPNTPVIFQQDWKPQLSFDLNTQTTELAENVYEVCLNLSIETKLEDSGDVAFLCEVQQAGIFTITGLEGVQLAHCLGAQCPTILFPYARELVASLVNRGTFPALNLSPINFDALFMQQLQQQQEVQESVDSDSESSDNESESSENEQIH